MALPSPAPVSTRTRWPAPTSARTPAGGIPTPYSRGLISLGTPMSTVDSFVSERRTIAERGGRARRERAQALVDGGNVDAARQPWGLSDVTFPFILRVPSRRVAMPTPGKLEVTIKINELPTEVTTNKNGWKEFKLDCGGRIVAVSLRPRMWTKIEEAAKSWRFCTATLAG